MKNKEILDAIKALPVDEQIELLEVLRAYQAQLEFDNPDPVYFASKVRECK